MGLTYTLLLIGGVLAGAITILAVVRARKRSDYLNSHYDRIDRGQG